MDNYYSLLGVGKNASSREIKRAFRERAKQLHPDIAGKNTAGSMRRLLAAYETLSSRDRRFEYDRAYARFMERGGFDYRTFLRDRPGDPASQAKLIFFELLHLNDDEAVEIWQNGGGLDFRLERYLEREDWMDCTFILAEELAKRGYIYESFCLLTGIVREERRRPYFKHFMEDVEAFLKEIARYKLKHCVDAETWIECLETLLDLGFPQRDEKRWTQSLAETLFSLGEKQNAEALLKKCC
jgi:hypothetical protein